MDPEFFRALADPTRVRLVACIAKCGRGCSVGEVAQCCSVDLSVVSRHLALLARAGVLEATKRGRTVVYAVRYEAVCGTLRAMADAFQGCCPGPEGCGSGCGNGNGGPCDGGCC